MRRAFSFDASACTGCKACQVACKDRNALPSGVLWRRVYEVSGGTWEPRGAAWTHTVFAYNVSVGCNHCADPVCASACPTGACAARDDGVVWIDAGKCVGCEYCAWVCPYGAPQYSPRVGHMTKCDFCRDLLDEGLPPACVAACPMRALDVALVDEPRSSSRAHDTSSMPAQDAAPAGVSAAPAIRELWKLPAAEHPFPLPAASRTQPLLAVTPHPAMLNDLPKVVANDEEVRPPLRLPRIGGRSRSSDLLAFGSARLEHLPLVAFTLLAQAAAGLAVISLLTRPLSRTVLFTIGAMIAGATLLSLLHLGTASRAWRATANVRRSALSREILALGVFGTAWLLALFAPAVGHVALAVAAVGLVWSMADVYRVDAVPGWTTWRTLGAFAWSALLLGLVVSLAISWLALEPVPDWLVLVVGPLAVGHLFVVRRRFYEKLHAKVM